MSDAKKTKSGGEEGASGPPKPRDAQQLSQSELRKELLARGLEPCGFWQEDMEVVQKIFDQEYQKALADEHDRMKEEANRKKAAANAARLARQSHRERLEEEDALRKRPDVGQWLSLLQKGQCSPDAAFSVRPVIARLLAQHPSNLQGLISLDLSRNGLDEKVGAALGGLLERNSSLVKLELAENELGPQSASALSDALVKNSTLRYLGLEDNPLTAQQRNFAGVEALASMLAVNSAITTLCLRMTGLGVDGGRALAEAVMSNDTLLILDVDSSSVELPDLQAISDKLDENKAMRESRRTKERQDRLVARKAAMAQAEIDAKAKKEEEEAVWVEEQRAARAEARRQAAEAERRRQEEEERKRQEEREAAEKARLEAEALAAAKKKKKKKKK
jgi:hypothetical protein